MLKRGGSTGSRAARISTQVQNRLRTRPRAPRISPKGDAHGISSVLLRTGHGFFPKKRARGAYSPSRLPAAPDG
jgi:hypothetical protein